MIGVVNGPGTMALAIGLITRFSATGEVLHPILENDIIVNGLLGFGGLSMVVCAVWTVFLIKERARLNKEYAKATE